LNAGVLEPFVFENLEQKDWRATENETGERKAI
jgi:hypothetical protein